MTENHPRRGGRTGSTMSKPKNRREVPLLQTSSSEKDDKRRDNRRAHRMPTPNNQNQRPGPRNTWPLSYKKIDELQTEDPYKALFFLNSNSIGFKELLGKTNIAKGKNALLWSVIAKCCQCDTTETLSEFLKTVNESESFTVRNVQHLLLDVQNGGDEPYPEDVSTLENITTFLEALDSLPPSTVLTTMTFVLPILKDTVSSRVDSFGQNLLGRIDKLNEKRILLRENTRAQAQLPVENFEAFRRISIFPDKEDFTRKTDPFLKANIVLGRYQSVDQYLNIHFRLLREDFIRPLREGIDAYKQFVNENAQNALPKKRDIPKEIRVYQDVHILESSVTEVGIQHTVQFLLTDSFKRIHWASSKRLIFGSLLCFTNDFFETVFFGTVTERKEASLEKGQIQVRFEQPDLIGIGNSNKSSYTMIETTAYFESYRHVLTVLQDISVDTFPLKEYIVYLEKEVRPPKYAEDDDLVYCFDCVFYPKCIESLSDERKTAGFLYENLENSITGSDLKIKSCSFPGKKISIHQESAWSNIGIDLDKSQLSALRCALTQSVSVIQGPPGTGKTYIGMKIVEILMHNQRVWSPPSDPSPIVVVCYTNHALDQFLQGILKTTTNIVRIGGRSKCEELSKYNLVELRNRPSSIFGRRKFEIRDQIQILIREIVQLQEKCRKSNNQVLQVRELVEIIREEHVKSLVQHRPFYLHSCSDIYVDYILSVWLGLTAPDNGWWAGLKMTEAPDFFDEVDNEDDFQIVFDDTISVENNSNMNVVNENEFQDNAFVGEVDVDFLNDQRIIEGDSVDTLQTLEYVNYQENRSQKLNAGEQMRFNDCLNCAPMTPELALACNNVWKLSWENRWRLYRFWLNTFQEQCETKITENYHEYKKQTSILMECKQQIERTTIENSKIVGLTTTGAAKYNYLIRGMKSKIVIVEEAAEVLEAHVITSLTANTQHLILIGDHKQLRPNPTVYELAKQFKLEISLFERLIKNNFPYCSLETQHRMKPCMSKLLVPEVYEELIDDPSVHEYEDIKGLEKSMFFITHTENEYQSRDDTSRVNIHEINFLTSLCEYLLLQGYPASSITILTTYLAQFFAIKKRMVDTLKDVRVSVLDNFQGEENDIILLSFVRSSEDGTIGFLKDDNRVCVALSRAKKGLYCIGNFELFAKQSKLWRSVCEKLKTQQAIGPSLNIKCQRHERIVPIVSPADFLNVRDGGCTENCDYRLDCGHVCPRKCHPDDEEHVDFQCKKPCPKIICFREHECKKQCWEECGDCTVLLEKIVPNCSHTVRLECFIDEATIICPQRCTKYLDCSHLCPGICGRDCSSYSCSKMVTETSPCGHEVKVECKNSKDPSWLKSLCGRPCERFLGCGHKCTKRCRDICTAHCNVISEHLGWCGHTVSMSCARSQEDQSHWIMSESFHILYKKKANPESGCEIPCNHELQCGHLCTGTCGKCHQGRIHVSCKQPCEKSLVCGHKCTSPCSSTCPPCSKKCGNRCSHSRCGLPCGYPCSPCNEPCSWRCEHKRCTRLCNEPCDRTPCEMPCRKRLQCGHFCIGMCGEPCPKKCRICNKEEVSTIFFGEEDEPNARFLQLEDCGHIFEIGGISRWVEEQMSGDEIQLITCPQCREPIRRNLRFNAAVKSSVLKIEMVKRKTFGIRDENINRRKILLQSVEKEFQKRIILCGHGEKCSTDPETVLKLLISRLRSPKISGDQSTLCLFENYFTFAKGNHRLTSKLCELPLGINLKRSDMFQRVCDFWGHTLWVINKVISNHIQRGSDQLMEDLVQEFDRLRALIEFIEKFRSKLLSEQVDEKSKISEILTLLLSYSPFGEEKNKKVTALQEELKKLSGIAVLGVSDDERLTILKAMGLKQGHWYQCPNGHIYCITECGGAMIESKCNECGEKIGGGSHRLRTDNRVSTAMDGARCSAWSEQQNIANYDQL